MNRIPRKIIDFRNFLYSKTAPGGHYSSKLTINCPNDESITYESKRFKLNTAAPATQHTSDELIDKLRELMPARAESLNAEIAFTTKEERRDLFNVRILRDNPTNTSQQSAPTQLGSIFEDGQRYSARLANK